MNLETTQSQTLAKLTQEISIILVGTILLTLSAKIVVPFYPVPMSTQTLVVLGLGLFLGPVRSSLVVVTYFFEGLLGLPVFAGTPPALAGPAYIAGPTGGYLVGFALAAAAAGWIVQALQGLRPAFRASVAVFLGSIVMYCAGLLWLGGFVGYGEKLLNAGLYPFLLGDLTKATIAVVLYTAYHNRRAV
ncbi:MAG: biotin transporter BioY [Maritimibacter sp.]|uniref:biotin transporter BioY n=1 Tax=Maritimibacter sp. TaxID=2003363 RepID=UPI001D225817|nr:biotin transporter BioY [Maritimibacter sp.]MBL6429869.1 biotin transporter BioY [Maritimibacter sp.]